jgi:catechol 2,3-dioxygenase-like lactoylglutathione lyase family enzyme
MTKPRGRGEERKAARQPPPAAGPDATVPHETAEPATQRLRRTVPVLPTRDLARAVAFWAERLGFAMSFRFADSAGVVRDDVEVHFTLVPAPAVAAGGCRIEVSDVVALQRELLATGVVAPEAGRADAGFALELVVIDPDGNRIVFTQWAGGGI